MPTQVEVALYRYRASLFSLSTRKQWTNRRIVYCCTGPWRQKWRHVLQRI